MSMLCEFYLALEYLVTFHARGTLLYLLELARTTAPPPAQAAPLPVPADRGFIFTLPPPRVIE